MAEYATLIQTQRVVKGQGLSCSFGCNEAGLPEAIAFAKGAFPDKPYCVVSDWTWVDIVRPGELEANDGKAEDRPSIIYAGKVVADEAHRPHLGPVVRTSPLCEFHRDCIFVTKNRVYILCGRGNRTTLSSALFTDPVL